MSTASWNYQLPESKEEECGLAWVLGEREEARGREQSFPMVRIRPT